MTIATTTLSKKAMVFSCLRRNPNLRPVQIQNYVSAKYNVDIASNVATMCRQDFYREILHKTAPRLTNTITNPTTTRLITSVKKSSTSRKKATSKITSSSTTSSSSAANVISSLRQMISAVKAVGGPQNALQIINLLK